MQLIERFRRRPVLAVCWGLNLLTLPLMAIFGRGLAEGLNGLIGDKGIMLTLGGLTGLLLIISAYFLVKFAGWKGLFHIGWILMILVPLMYYVSQSPERWLHIPLFGMLGFLSSWLFSLRTGAEISLGYSFGDELLQLYLPERHGTFEDVLINAFCASLGVFLCWLIVDDDDAR